MQTFDFILSNIVLIDKYLNNQMTDEERKAFKQRLREDKSFRADFDMVLETYKKDKPHKRLNAKEEIFFDSFNNKRLPGKAALAKNLLQYGLIGAGIATALLFLCAMLLAYIG